MQPCRAVNPVCTVACLFQHQLPGSTVESCLHCGLSVSASASWQHCGVLFAALQSCKSCLHCGLSVSASAVWQHCVCGILFALWPVCFSISCLAALCLWNPVCIVACLFQHQLPGITVESCLQPCRAVNPVCTVACLFQHQLPGSTVESCLHCGLSVSASASWQHCGVLFAALQSCKSCLHCGLSVSASAVWQHCVCGILFALWPVCFSISCLAALWSPVCSPAEL